MICLSTLRIIPESPRWLSTKNRKAEAFKVFGKIAKYNKKKLEFQEELEKFQTTSDNDEKPDEIKTVYL